IPTWGIVGAGISSMVSFFSMFIIRYLDTKNLISLQIRWKKVMLTLLLIGIQIFILFIGLSIRVELILNAFILAIILLVNLDLFDYLIRIYQSIRNRNK